ncbi:MAG: hypothetical protein IKJ45_14670, partial [Kiritimatiellae bacterium]|nr:hypothetical protein [Kiritimatiellia bacterium]
MNQTSSDMSQNFTIGDLAYDAQLQALRHGKRMEFLTLCESKIVAYLFRNPGRQSLSATNRLSKTAELR